MADFDDLTPHDAGEAAYRDALLADDAGRELRRERLLAALPRPPAAAAAVPVSGSTLAWRWQPYALGLLAIGLLLVVLALRGKSGEPQPAVDPRWASAGAASASSADTVLAQANTAVGTAMAPAPQAPRGAAKVKPRTAPSAPVVMADASLPVAQRESEAREAAAVEPPVPAMAPPPVPPTAPAAAPPPMLADRTVPAGVPAGRGAGAVRLGAKWYVGPGPCCAAGRAKPGCFRRGRSGEIDGCSRLSSARRCLGSRPGRSGVSPAGWSVRQRARRAGPHGADARCGQRVGRGGGPAARCRCPQGGSRSPGLVGRRSRQGPGARRVDRPAALTKKGPPACARRASRVRSATKVRRQRPWPCRRTPRSGRSSGTCRRWPCPC